MTIEQRALLLEVRESRQRSAFLGLLLGLEPLDREPAPLDRGSAVAGLHPGSDDLAFGHEPLGKKALVTRRLVLSEAGLRHRLLQLTIRFRQGRSGGGARLGDHLSLGGDLVIEGGALRHERGEARALFFEPQLLDLRLHFDQHVAGVDVPPDLQVRGDDAPGDRGVHGVSGRDDFEAGLVRDLVERDPGKQEPRAPGGQDDACDDQGDAGRPKAVSSERAQRARKARRHAAPLPSVGLGLIQSPDEDVKM